MRPASNFLFLNDVDLIWPSVDDFHVSHHGHLSAVGRKQKGSHWSESCHSAGECIYLVTSFYWFSGWNRTQNNWTQNKKKFARFAHSPPVLAFNQALPTQGVACLVILWHSLGGRPVRPSVHSSVAPIPCLVHEHANGTEIDPQFCQTLTKMAAKVSNGTKSNFFAKFEAL